MLYFWKLDVGNDENSIYGIWICPQEKCLVEVYSADLRLSKEKMPILSLVPNHALHGLS